MADEKETIAQLAPHFNIKAVINQTGLNPATIRAWERRYGVPTPQRSKGGHRQYSQQDIDTLKWLIARQNEGISISHAIEMFQALNEAGQDPLAEEEAATEGLFQFTSEVASEQVEQLREAWIVACLAFDRQTAEQILSQAFALFPAEVVCFQILQKSLSEIGQRWYENKVTVQQEHFTSALSNQRLEMLIAGAPPPHQQGKLIVAAAPGDDHLFSPLLLTYFLRRRGWHVVYLGANVPADELAEAIKRIQPQLVVLSAQMLHTAAGLIDIAQATYAQGVRLAFGGLIFNQLSDLRERIPGYFLGETLEEAVVTAATLMEKKPPPQEPPRLAESYQAALNQYTERLALIESHIWSAFIVNKMPRKDLATINHEISRTVSAALILGDINLLSGGLQWLEYLLVAYRLPAGFLNDYIQAFYQAAVLHLGGPGNIVVDWLAGLMDEVDNVVT